MSDFVNWKHKEFRFPLFKPSQYDGGKVLIERLIQLFELRSRIELAEVIGVTAGTLSTWTTRNTVPHELILRTHLSTGISVEFLCFGTGLEYKERLTRTSQAELFNSEYPIGIPLRADGGRKLIERLISLFNVRNRIELADLIGVTPANLSTWSTRNTVPYEVILRLHLSIGANVEYLCFGKGDPFDIHPLLATDSKSKALRFKHVARPHFTAEAVTLSLEFKTLENGKLVTQSKIPTVPEAFKEYGITDPSNSFALKTHSKTYFIASEEVTVTSGWYLFSIDGDFQLGNLRKLPDGKVYMMDHDDRFEVNLSTTKIQGKVVSILEKF